MFIPIAEPEPPSRSDDTALLTGMYVVAAIYSLTDTLTDTSGEVVSSGASGHALATLVFVDLIQIETRLRTTLKE